MPGLHHQPCLDQKSTPQPSLHHLLSTEPEESRQCARETVSVTALQTHQAKAEPALPFASPSYTLAQHLLPSSPATPLMRTALPS